MTMHEVSLVRNMFSTLEEQFSPEELARMTQIDLKVGELSNVEPTLLQNAFEAVCIGDDKYMGVQLDIEWVPVEIYCDDCQTRTRIRNYTFVCTCGKPSNQVVQGTELLIAGVYFEET